MQNSTTTLEIAWQTLKKFKHTHTIHGHSIGRYLPKRKNINQNKTKQNAWLQATKPIPQKPESPF